MCGRFSFSASEKIIEDTFGVAVNTAIHKIRFNCAPSQNLAIITNSEPYQINYYRWGLIPSWAKDSKIGNSLINARAETINEKPSFKNSFKSRRCLVLADGFFEWEKNTKAKKPFYFFIKNHLPFAMAGIWDEWTNLENKVVRSFSIITTKANELIEPIHERMPVILPKTEHQKYLLSKDLNKITNLLIPFSADEMDQFPVSDLVNSALVDAPEVIISLK